MLMKADVQRQVVCEVFCCSTNERALCLICRNNIACLKEFNIKRHYNSRHSKQYDGILGQLQVDKAHQFKKSLQGQQKMTSLYKSDTQLGTELSFKLSEAVAEKAKVFSDGKFVMHCLMIFAERACPDKKYLIEQTSLSRFTVARRSMPSQVILKTLWCFMCFMESGNQDVSFFNDIEWGNDLALLTDVTPHLSIEN